MRTHACLVASVALMVITLCGGCSNTPNYDRAKEIGRDYSTTVFDLSLTGTRSLGADENYTIIGQIRPVTKRVSLGEYFELSRGDIISLSGVLTEIDKDHLRLEGHFRGQGPAQIPLDTAVDVSIELGIHGGIHYFREADNPYPSAAGNDYLEIDKVENKELPGRPDGGDD